MGMPVNLGGNSSSRENGGAEIRELSNYAAWSAAGARKTGRQEASNTSINHSKRRTSYATRLLKTKQHTTPAELESHNPMPANHMDTP